MTRSDQWRDDRGRQRNRATRRVGFSVLLLSVTVAGSAAAQSVALTVRVEDQADSAPIPNASVQLVGTTSSIADANGRVRFEGLVRGSHIIVVDAIGYESVRVPLLVENDTTVRIQLKISPIPLDSILVVPRTFTLLAQLLGSDTRRAVPYADVFVGGNADRSDAVGFFRMRRLPAEDSLELVVRAIGYMPTTIRFAASRDTTMRVHLEPDPIGKAMIERQHRRLDTTVRGVPFPVRTLPREAVTRHAAASLRDALKLAGVDASRANCIMVDDRPRFPEYLDSFLPEEIDRVYIINRGRMIRVYTYDYVRRRLPGRSVIPVTTFSCI